MDTTNDTNGKAIIYARKIINSTPSPTDIDIMRYMKSEEGAKGIPFIELRDMVVKLQEIDAKNEKKYPKMIFEENIQTGYEEINVGFDEDIPMKILAYKHEAKQEEEDYHNHYGEEEYVTLKPTMKKGNKKDIISQNIKQIGVEIINKIKSIDMGNIKSVFIKMFSLITIIFKCILKHTISYEPKTYKMVLMYKRKVQKELDEAEKILEKRNTTPDDLARAEKVVNKLKKKIKFNDLPFPSLSFTQTLLISWKFTLYDLRGMTLLLIINFSFLVAYFKNYMYIDTAQNIIFTGIIVNVIFSFFYAIISLNKIKELILENNLQEFMWQEFPKGKGIETEFYSIFNKVENAERTIPSREREEPSVDGDDLSFIRERVRGRDRELDNPYETIWKEIFTEFFKNKTYKKPELINLETTEVHIFNIPTMSITDFVGKQEQIENFIGKKIYKIHKEYGGRIGVIAIEFETVELPRIVKYDEVPDCKDTEIILGKSVKEWITWDLNTIPHALVVGATGGGKSVTMNFLISEIIKKDWLPYFVDFKGGVEFNIYKDKGYTVVIEKNDFLTLTSELSAELEYRSRLFAENRAKSLKMMNKRSKSKKQEELPRIVVILDEYADVNSVKDDTTEMINSNMGRILAKGRAVGIHLIIGTQRPDATTIGSGAFRDNIACRIVGKMNSESAWGMAFGTGTLTKEDKVYTNKVPDDDRFKGMFVVQGTGTINDKEIIRVPYMEEDKFDDMVTEDWEDNNHNYTLHRNSTVEEEIPMIDTNGNNLDEMEVPKLPSSKFDKPRNIKKELEIEVENKKGGQKDFYNVFNDKKPDLEDIEDLFDE